MEQMQTTLTGEKIEKYYCIHCPYIGYETVEKNVKEEFELSRDRFFKCCPKCGWVLYSEERVKEQLGSNVYPLLTKKWNKLHGTDIKIWGER